MSNATNTALERIENLLDAGSFVEVGAGVRSRSTNFNLATQDTPKDGVITGYGVIDGNLVYVYSQDSSVLGGAVGEMHGKKIAALYDMALKMGAPIIGLLDSTGLRLQEGVDALNGFAEIYSKQSMCSGVIPSISVVFGNAGGALNILTELSDFAFMEEDASLYISAKDSVPGDYTEKDDNTSASFQSKKVGSVDFVGTKDEIVAEVRKLISLLPSNNEDNDSYDECTDSLNRLNVDAKGSYGDVRLLIADISDDSLVFETKKDHAREMATAFIRLNGQTVGVIANAVKDTDEEGKGITYPSTLSTRGARKAKVFLDFCDAFSIPVLTIVNMTGFENSMCAEKNLGRVVSRLVYSYANATVPKVTLITDKAYGSAYMVMGSKALGADQVFAWEGAKIAMMDSDLASQILGADKNEEERLAISKEYDELQGSAMSAASRGLVDTIIDPTETRKYLIGAFEMLFTKRESRPDKKHGTK
ncbi:MAG: carboxyl transferase [Lachnospiraceae bacterium]|nr:carboxyl transferase [Lachnospiraceae bacterium]